MPVLPPELLERLSDEYSAALQRAVKVVGEELAANYRVNADDHKESRGDTARLFGMKIYEHQRFRLEGRFDDDTVICLDESNGSYSLLVGPLRIGVYKVGNLASEDIQYRFPEGSPTKLGYGERNQDQLTLFDAPAEGPLPAEAAYALNDLTIAHFGNPRERLVKWYIGAFVADQQNRLRWAWVRRQDVDGLRVRPTRPRESIVPYSERKPEDLTVAPRRRRPAVDDVATSSE